VRFLISILLNALSFYIGSRLISGIELHGIWAAIIAGILLGVANITIKPILNLIALPVTILTLGLFILIINAIVLLLVSYFVPGFVIINFGAAFLLGILLILLNWLYSVLRLRR
jgi:putative membrane protein